MTQVFENAPNYCQQLKKDIEMCEQMRQDSIKSQDKLVITLSSGALALSLTIYDKIYAGVYPQLLILTWGLYFTSLLSTLISFLTAQITFDEQISCFTAKENKEAYSSKRFVIFQRCTAILNYVSICTFVIASILFITFASLNLLNKETDMTIIAQNGLTTNSMTQKILTEGLTPNKASIAKIENGLTPNTISKSVIIDKTTSPQPNSQNQNSSAPQNLPEDNK